MAEEQKIQQAIRKGAKWLQAQQNVDGSFGKWGPGSTCLATLALQKAGLPDVSDTIGKAVSCLIRYQPYEDAYFHALTVMTLAAVDINNPGLLRRLKADSEWLIQAQNRDPGDTSMYGGWGAAKFSQANIGAQTHYAIMALYSATLVGISVPDAVWRRATSWYGSNLAFPDEGGDGAAPACDDDAVSLRSLAAAAWASLKIIRLVVKASDLIQTIGNLAVCTEKWLADNYATTFNPDTADTWYYFCLYSLAQGCVFTPACPETGSHEWHNELADNLIMLQNPDGQWTIATDVKSSAIVYTSLALLALDKFRSSGIMVDPYRSARLPQRSNTANGRRKISRNCLIRRAGFSGPKTLEEFDFSRLLDVTPESLLQLADDNFVAERKDVIFVGKSGVGKTHLATALGICACRLGYKVRFYNAFTLADKIAAAQLHPRGVAFMKKLSQIDLLIIDGLSFFELSRLQAELLFQVLLLRHERVSTIITTDSGLDQWPKLWGESAITELAVARALRQATVLALQPSSFPLTAVAAGTDEIGQ